MPKSSIAMPHAELARARAARRCASPRVGDEHALGDLQLEQRRVDAASRRARRAAIVDEVAVARTGCAETFTATRSRACPPACQRAACAQRLAQHPVADRHDEAGLLGERDEVAGRHDAAPSGWCQRSSASTPITRPVAQVDLRLVVQLELVALERAAQRRSRAQARSRRAFMLGGEELVACRGPGPWRGTSPCRRCASASRRRRRRRDRARCRCCAARAARRRRSVNGCAQRLEDLAAPTTAASPRLVELGQHDHELVAAQARDGVALAHARGEPLRDLLQQLVAERRGRACR